jgi:energy-coupling factor transporter ATP-binding protein EcfA2
LAVNSRFHYAVSVGGVAAVTGEIGSGKSTAVRYAQAELHPAEYICLHVIATSVEWTPMSRQKRVEFKMVTDQSAAEWRCPNFYFTLRFIAVNNAFLTSHYLGNLSCHLMGMW